MDREKKNPEENKSEEEKNNVIIDDPEEVQKILEELSEKDPNIKKLIEDINSNPDVKSIKVYTTDNSIKTKILSIILTIIMNIVFGIALTGLIKWTRVEILELFIFTLLYSLMEVLLQYIVITFIPKVKLFTFGLSDFICSIIGFIFANLLITSVKIENLLLAIIFFVILNIIKSVVRYAVNKYRMEKKFKKWKK